MSLMQIHKRYRHRFLFQLEGKRTAILIVNIAVAFLGRIVNLFSNLIIISLAVSALGKENYGLLAMLISTKLFFTYADFGLGSSLVNSLSESDSRGDKHGSRELVGQIWIFLWAVGLFISALAFAAYQGGWVSDWFAAVPSDEIWLVWLLLIGGTVIGIPLAIDQRIYFAMQRGGSAQAWTLAGRVAVLAFVAWAFYFSPHLVSFIFAIAVAPALISAASCFYVFRSMRPDLSPSLSTLSFRGFSPRLHEGLLFALLNLCTFLEIGLDPLLFGQLFGPVVTADNDILIKLATYIPALANLAVTPLWPAVAAARASGDIRWITNANRIAAICMAIVAVAGTLALSSTLEMILNLWLHADAPQNLPQKSVALVFICLQTFGLYQLFMLNALNLVRFSAILSIFVPFIVLPVKIFAASSSGSIEAAYFVMIIWYVVKIIVSQLVIERRIREISSAGMRGNT